MTQHWTGPIGPTPSTDDLHELTLDLWRALVDGTLDGDAEGVRSVVQGMERPQLEQILLALVHETAVGVLTEEVPC